MTASVETIIAVSAALVTFGIGYNALVERLEREIPDHGYTSILVVGGVVVTLIGAAFLVGLTNALLVGLCFAASGLPMIAGSMYRFIRRRAAERSRVVADALESVRGGT